MSLIFFLPTAHMQAICHVPLLRESLFAGLPISDFIVRPACLPPGDDPPTTCALATTLAFPPLGLATASGTAPDAAPVAPPAPWLDQLRMALRALIRGDAVPSVECGPLLDELARCAGGSWVADAFEALQGALGMASPPLRPLLLPCDDPARLPHLVESGPLTLNPLLASAHAGTNKCVARLPGVIMVPASRWGSCRLPAWLPLAKPITGPGGVEVPLPLGYRLWSVVLYCGDPASPEPGHFIARCAERGTPGVRCRRCPGCFPDMSMALASSAPAPPPEGAFSGAAGADAPAAAVQADGTSKVAMAERSWGSVVRVGDAAGAGARPARRTWFEYDGENVRVMASEEEALTVSGGNCTAYLLLYAWCENR